MTISKKTLVATGAALALGLAASAHAGDSGNPFFIKTGAQDSHKGISVLEGKCGGGKCGSNRVRRMMDGDGNGMISRKEYSDWAARMAAMEFDEISKNGGAATPKDVFDFFGVEHAS